MTALHIVQNCLFPRIFSETKSITVYRRGQYCGSRPFCYVNIWNQIWIRRFISFPLAGTYNHCSFVVSVLRWPSCHGCPVVVVLLWMCCNGCPILAVLWFWLSYNRCPIRARLSCHSCNVMMILTLQSHLDCPTMPVSDRISCKSIVHSH